ncbi:MAG TPA: hypothetical protein VNN21_06230 [Dehalococcoidia bacterium]|nr:hypothetical protein [Dehalococcoidia bacterium]
MLYVLLRDGSCEELPEAIDAVVKGAYLLILDSRYRVIRRLAASEVIAYGDQEYLKDLAARPLTDEDEEGPDP